MKDGEGTGPLEQSLASLAHLLQALLSPVRYSLQSQGTLPSTRAQSGSSQRLPQLWAEALWETGYFIFMCQDLYKKGIVQL